MLKAFLAIWMAACGTVLAAPPKRAISPKTSAEQELRDPLAMADKALPMLSSDPDLESRGRVKLVEAFLTRGDFREARARANQIADYRRGTMLAALAAATARKGDHKLAEECLEEAAKASAQEAGWKQERITAHICIANAELGNFDKAFEQLKNINEFDDIVRARSGFARAYARHNKLDQAGEQAGQAAGGFAISTAPMQAEAFLEIAEALERAKDNKGAADAARKAVNSTEKIGWLGIEAIRRAGELFHRLGEKEKSAALLKNARATAMQISDRAEFKGAVISALAQSYARCGQREEAVTLLKDAERAADTMELNFRCAPLAAIGGAWARLGDGAAAERVWQKAAVIVAEHKNPRVKGMGIIDVCMAVAAADATIPGAIRKMFVTVLSRSTESSPI